MTTARSSETSVYFRQTTWRRIPEDFQPHNHNSQNLKLLAVCTAIWPNMDFTAVDRGEGGQMRPVPDNMSMKSWRNSLLSMARQL